MFSVFFLTFVQFLCVTAVHVNNLDIIRVFVIQMAVTDVVHQTVQSNVLLLQALQAIDACTDIAYNVTAPAAGGIVSSRSVFLLL